MGGAYLYSEHSVDEDQKEKGIPDEDQAAFHTQNFLLGTAILDVTWAPVRWLAFSGNVPLRAAGIAANFLDADRKNLPDFESIHHRNEVISGPGDPRFSIRLQPLFQRDHGGVALFFWAGAQVPVGKINPDPFALGRQNLKHQHLFFGNGIVVPSGGANLSWGLKWFRIGGDFEASLAAYANRFGYLPPSRGRISVYAESGFGLEDWTFRLQPEVGGETPANWAGRPARNSGRLDPRISTSVFWRAAPRLEFWFQARLTPYTFALGGQLLAPVLLVVGASWDVALPDLSF